MISNILIWPYSLKQEHLLGKNWEGDVNRLRAFYDEGSIWTEMHLDVIPSESIRILHKI